MRSWAAFAACELERAEMLTGTGVFDDHNPANQS
ncbi:hypothetical protein Cflav_PD2640 [Pedosphaera parvula Ellin514]|uniref:Uncharacterized protein n=1 Tax=Pedosphaera parvula (strain Ellin514) TaxID=320771 RepID=B9XKI1_PEDPL|nr:hypothetical protein Cflav_PD2640 [Pedosphaera parvula Ellin514]